MPRNLCEFVLSMMLLAVWRVVWFVFTETCGGDRMMNFVLEKLRKSLLAQNQVLMSESELLAVCMRVFMLLELTVIVVSSANDRICAEVDDWMSLT